MPFLQVDEAVELMRMEYAEMPGLKLTFVQAQRLWNISQEACERALGELTRSGFLDRTRDGAYVRRASGINHGFSVGSSEQFVGATD
jgi:Fic family protein